MYCSPPAAAAPAALAATAAAAKAVVRTSPCARFAAVAAVTATLRPSPARALYRTSAAVAAVRPRNRICCHNPVCGRLAGGLFCNLVRGYSAKSLPPNTVITMPALSPTMTQGNIGTWHKKIGDKVTAGDVLVEIETDKAQMDFECQDEGYLAKILADTGTKDVPINRPIAIFVDEAADIPKVADFVPDAAGGASMAAEKTNPAPATKQEPPTKPTPATKQETPTERLASSPDAKSAPARAEGGRVIASPLAKVLASEKGINLREVDGSGPNGRVVKADVDSFAQSVKAQPAKAATAAAPGSTVAFTDIPVTSMRKVIAQRLTQSKQNVPHYYVTVEVEMDKIMKLREALNREAENVGAKLSINDFVIKASALALKVVPEANSAWNGDFIRQFHSADICVATATPGGLITPIVRNAEQLGLASISSRVRDLASRAREGKLAPHEYQGGTFTISNLGMFGVKDFSAIINPPQACILAVGATEKKVVPGAADESTFEIRNVMNVSLSCDHRVVDGAVGATWLKVFKGYMEQPLTMLL